VIGASSAEYLTWKQNSRNAIHNGLMWGYDFFETILRKHGYSVIAGVDEVGRGSLAGPVVAAAVILECGGDFSDIRDSKVLSARSRDKVAGRIRREAIAIGVGAVGETEIDRINILQATKRAMIQAVSRLPIRPEMVLVDGFWLAGLTVPCMGIVQGDSRSYSIAAASIVAKVQRDKLMTAFAGNFPHYGFERNKGYGSTFHRQAIAEHGPCAIHRRSFGGVREFVAIGGDNGGR